MTIKNIGVYNDRMAQTIIDKLFFVEHIFADAFVDFGCADGSLLYSLQNLLGKEVLYAGVDNNEKMLELAREKFEEDGLLSYFTYSLEDATAGVNAAMEDNKSFETKALIMNSVIHEIYSYLTEEEIEKLWATVKDGGYDFIAIRDMTTFGIDNSITIKKPTYDQLIQKADPEQVADFERVWGSLKKKKNFLHFLLKYHYKDNWEHELAENYFAIQCGDLIKKIESLGYSVEYYETFRVHYLDKKIRKDLGVNLTDEKTHVKLIFRKKPK